MKKCKSLRILVSLFTLLFILTSNFYVANINYLGLNGVVNAETSTSLRVHFQKPSNWGTPSVYYYDDNKSLTGPTWNSSPQMVNEGNGWYYYDLPASWATANTKVIFKSGSNQLPGSQQPGIKVSQETWVTSNGTATTTDPNGETLKIHFQKPSNWGTPSVYYYDDNKSLTGPAWASAPAMTDEGNGWFSYALPSAWKTAGTRVIFKSGNIQLPGSQQPGIRVSQETWVDSNGNATIVDPTGKDTTPPVVSSNLKSGTYQGVQSLTFTATDNKDSSPKVYYTTDGTTPTTTSTLYTGAISLNVGTTTVKAIGVDASGNVSSVTTLNFVIENQNTKTLKVHFQKPSGWGNLSVYYYDDNKALTGPTWAAAPTMTEETNGWFAYELPSAWSTAATRVIFKDGSNQLPASQQPGVKISQETWVYSDGTTTTTDPNVVTPDVTAPIVSISPSSGTYTDPASVTITATDDRDKSPKIYYTTDGTEPTTSSKLYTSSISLAIGTTTVKAIAVDAAGNKSASVTANYTVKTNPDPQPTTSTFSWGNANVYFVMTDRFVDGDTSNDNSYGRVKVDASGRNTGTFHGGDLKGLTQKLKEGYFKNLGTNAIWITSPYEQMHGFVGGGDDGKFAHYGYHGYYPLDWTEMDKNMGTVADMREFVNTAHAQGIRVVLDVVMNHTGYLTLKDMSDYGIYPLKDGADKNTIANWTPSNGGTWHGYHDALLDYTGHNAEWAKWWSSGWLRAGVPGYQAGGNDSLTMNVSNLPDVKTETTTNQGLAPILNTKWSKETTGYDNWILPSEKSLRTDLGIAPADYEVKWLAAWVKEFGIDGFRCDTAKHVDVYRWGQLKDAANAALKDWRTANPTDSAAKWTDNFWMTGEDFDRGLDKTTGNYYTTGKFDSMINFTFPKDGNINAIDTTWSSYANQINTTTNFNVLSYVSSHDTALSDRNNLVNIGTTLLLSPGAVQTYYGDETARPLSNVDTVDKKQATRSDMNWGSENKDVLAHWQILGQFRNKHISIGAGAHKKISSSPYTFSRVYDKNGVKDSIIGVLGATGSTSVDVSSVFADGTTVRDFYTGNTAVVSGGKVTFNAGAKGVILIETATEGPIVKVPIVSATPGSQEFTTDTLDILLGLKNATTGKYSINGGTEQSYTDGQKVTIGSDMKVGDKATIKVSATNNDGSASESYVYSKVNKPIETKFTIHFKKPAAWSGVNMYYYDDAKKLTGPAWDAAPAMTDEGNGFYSYTIPDDWKTATTKVIFRNGSNQVPGAQQSGIAVTGETWLDESGNVTTKPNGVTAVATPGTSSFTDKVTVTLKAVGTNVTIAKYTLDGSNPVNGTSFTNGTTIEIGSGMNANDKKTLKIYVSNGTDTDTKEFVYTKTSTPTLQADFKSIRMYQVMVDCFQDGDSSVGYGAGWGPSSTNWGGDLKGILNALPYIKSTGVNALWMTPIFDSNGAEDYNNINRYKLDSTGYFAQNYFSIDPKFGSFADAKAVVDKAHELGMYVIFDGVFGHHKANVTASPSGKYPQGSDGPVSYPGSLDFYKEVATYWIDKLDIDGWRLDQSYQVPKDSWNQIRKAVEAKCAERKAQGKQWGTLGYMVAEDWESFAQIKDHTYGYDSNSAGLYSAFDFPTHYAVIDAFAKGKSAIDLNNSMNAHDYDYPSHANPNLFLDNHDMNRFGNEIGLDKGNQDYWNKYKMAVAFMAAYTGPITLYYGDEIGDKINDYSGSAGDNCSRTTGQTTNLDSNQQSMHDYTAAVMKLRDENSALWKGTRKNLKAEYDVYADLKTDGDNKVVYVFNKGGNGTTVSLSGLPGTKLVDLQTGETISISNGNANIQVGRMTSRFLKVQ